MGSISIADMEAVSRSLGPGPDFRISDDIGTVIDLGGDDEFGLNMIANQSKMSMGGSPSIDIMNHDKGPSVSIPPIQFGGSSDPLVGTKDGIGGIELTPLEPLEPIQMDVSPGSNAGGLGSEFKIQREGVNPSFSNSQSATGPGVQLSSVQRDPEAEKKEKVDLLNKLQRLEQKGFPVARKFSMDNSLEEIKQEYLRLVDARQLETSIKFQRQMLMGAITGLEWMNGRFDPFDLKLDGWSESVHENIEDFDEIFEELYDKYKDKGKMAPEMRLLLAIGGSGFMCHVSNSFFRSKMPGVDEVLRRNPDLARQMAAAAAQSAGPGFGNFMGMAMGVPPAGGMAPSSMEPVIPPGPQSSPIAPSGPFYSAASATPAPPAGPQFRGPNMGPPPTPVTARKEMRGPSGVDDILRTFEEARRVEIEEARSQPTMTSTHQPAAVAAAELASLHSEELASQADTVRTGATGGRRRRRAQPPVGNTVSLNV